MTPAILYLHSCSRRRSFRMGGSAQCCRVMKLLAIPFSSQLGKEASYCSTYTYILLFECNCHECINCSDSIR
eukprot:CCRYP_009912-RA/>CCRYP_009912-RA protein AED:0.45 eAED:0.45 QI:252/1/1/1/0/0/3/30/71